MPSKRKAKQIQDQVSAASSSIPSSPADIDGDMNVSNDSTSTNMDLDDLTHDSSSFSYPSNNSCRVTTATNKLNLSPHSTLSQSQSVETALEHLAKVEAELAKLDASHIQPLITLIKSIELPSTSSLNAQNQNQNENKSRRGKQQNDALSANASENARLYASVAYALQTLYFIYLRTNGVSPDDHPVKRELERVRKVVETLKQ